MKRRCVKENFDIIELFIQCNTDSCCEHIMGGVNKWVCQFIGP